MLFCVGGNKSELSSTSALKEVALDSFAMSESTLDIPLVRQESFIKVLKGNVDILVNGELCNISMFDWIDGWKLPFPLTFVLELIDRIGSGIVFGGIGPLLDVMFKATEDTDRVAPDIALVVLVLGLIDRIGSGIVFGGIGEVVILLEVPFWITSWFGGGNILELTIEFATNCVLGGNEFEVPNAKLAKLPNPTEELVCDWLEAPNTFAAIAG